MQERSILTGSLWEHRESMAKTVGPLLSFEAKGRYGKKLVFYSKNHVRGWSTQIDPQTAAQMAANTTRNIGCFIEIPPAFQIHRVTILPCFLGPK